MDTGEVRKRLQQMRRLAHESGEARRARVAAAEDAYQVFLRKVATPLARQVTDALRAEGTAVTLSTPKGGLRLALDHGANDYIEIGLDTSGPQPQVMGRTSVTRGDEVVVTERPVTAGAAPDAVREDELLAFVLESLAPWLSR